MPVNQLMRIREICFNQLSCSIGYACGLVIEAAYHINRAERVMA